MNNLIVSWKELAKEKYGSINEGVRHLNNILGLKLTSSCVNEMAKGKKNVPASIINHITRLMILNKFKKEKYKMTEINLEEFLESISIPKRIR